MKGMTVSFHKVKSHSGNKYNDEADRLAKERAKTHNVVKIKWPWNATRPITLRWRNYLVDSPIWEFVKKVTTSV